MFETVINLKAESELRAGMTVDKLIAEMDMAKGAPAIRTKNALLSAYIYVDLRGRDIGSYVKDARRAVNQQGKFPPGYYVTWSGQFEYMQRAIERLKIVVPLTLFVIFMLLYLNFKRLTETLIVMLSVPFALVGGVWLMWALGYNLPVAVAVASSRSPAWRRKAGW